MAEHHPEVLPVLLKGRSPAVHSAAQAHPAPIGCKLLALSSRQPLITNHLSGSSLRLPSSLWAFTSFRYGILDILLTTTDTINGFIQFIQGCE